MSKDFRKNEENMNEGKFNRQQYGKKGWKPRNSRGPRAEVDLDKVTTNKIEYWNKTDAFTNVTKFPWPLIIGQQLDYAKLLGEPAIEDTPYAPSSIMKIHFVPGPGYTGGDVHDGVNDALALMMTKIRASLSTSNIGFETADLGILNAALASTAALIGVAKRAIGVYHHWDGRNYTLPRALLRSMKFNYEDLRTHFNDYVGQLKTVIEEYNGLQLLDIFDVYDRQYTMCHNVFADEDSSFGQTFYFMPDGYYTYEDDDVDHVPYAKWHSTLPINNFQKLLDAIMASIDSWKRSSDFYQINGVLHRAFKDAPVQVIPQLNEDEAIAPVVDRAFTMQLMNATLMGYVDDTSCDIRQALPDQDALMWEPRTYHNINTVDEKRYVSSKYRLLRVFEDDPNADDNMEMTRLTCFGTTYYDEESYTWYTWCDGAGTEFVSTIDIYTYNGESDMVDYVEMAANVIRVDGDADPGLYYAAFKTIGYLSPFRYIPLLVICYHDPVENIDKCSGILGDLYNYMLYEEEDFRRLQVQALRSVWKPKNV